MTDAPFPPSSRYHGVPVVKRAFDDGTVEVHLTRRILPDPRRHVAIARRRLDGADRLDTVAYDAYGDPALWWRIVDASGEADPATLAGAEGRLVVIPLPLEIADHGHT